MLLRVTLLASGFIIGARSAPTDPRCPDILLQLGYPPRISSVCMRWSPSCLWCPSNLPKLPEIIACRHASHAAEDNVAHLCAGPSGFTVREIIKLTDADIKSWTDAGCGDDAQRPTRTFIIEARTPLQTLADCPLSHVPHQGNNADSLRISLPRLTSQGCLAVQHGLRLALSCYRTCSPLLTTRMCIRSILQAWVECAAPGCSTAERGVEPMPAGRGGVRGGRAGHHVRRHCALQGAL